MLLNFRPQNLIIHIKHLYGSLSHLRLASSIRKSWCCLRGVMLWCDKGRTMVYGRGPSLAIKRRRAFFYLLEY